jgi:uncharacterized protein with FMN-binding domain
MKRGLLIGVGTLGGLGAVFAITPPQFGTSGPTGLAALPGKAAAPSSAPSAAPSSAPTKAATTPTKAATTPTKAPTTPTKAPTTPTKSATTPTKAAPQPAQTTPATPATPAASAGITGTFDGNTAQTRWGPVQVRIVVKDGKITAASALQYPNGDRRSADISRQAIPYLVQETLAAQSDQISGVGGASYTSNGWYQSLQSALKKAGL